MKDLSETAQVLAAAEAWRARHEQPQGWAVRQDGTSAKDVYEQLCQLGSNATREDVVLLTGDKALVAPQRCGECASISWSCVYVGGVGGTVLCVRCIHKALGVLMGLVRP